MKKVIKYALIALFIAAIAVFAVINALKSDDINDNNGEVQVASQNENNYPLAVYFVDVGQGDGIVIRNKEQYIVIDGGEWNNSGAVTGLLNELGTTEIELYVATHPHSDHIGAAPDIFEDFSVKSVMTTSFSEFNIPTTKTYEMFLTAVEKEECEVIFAGAGDSFTVGEMTLDVFAPVQETADYNNMSIVFKLTYGQTSFLFTGDAEKDSEALMLESGADLKADVLKLGHHGSSDSTSESFFETVSPRVAVISCGKNNDYGHPHREILRLLEESGITFYRTDEDGTVVIFSDGKDIFIEDK